MARNVLIIGGTRFLGATVTRVFVEQGDRVWLMNRGSRAVPCDGVENAVCDKSNRTAFAELLRRRSWDVVVDTVLNDEDLTFVIDTLGTDVGVYVHTGSLGVYGNVRRLPALESEPLCEHDGPPVVFNYKLRQDQRLMQSFLEKAFPSVILRMSYIYGAGDIPLDGWGGRSMEFFRRLWAAESVPIPGTGEALLHPGHVNDLARAFIHAASDPRAVGQIYNVGGPFALRMVDYVQALAKAMDVEPRITFASIQDIRTQFPDETNERGMRFSTQHMCASIAKIETELGWRPEVSLAAGLRDNIDWLREQSFF